MKYYLFVTGCQQNIYDSNRIAHLLNKMGYVLGSEKNADLIVVVSCSVRQKPIDRIWGKFRLWLKRKPKPIIIVTGCLLTKDKLKMETKIDAFIPTDKIEKQLPKLLNGQIACLAESKRAKLSKNNNLAVKPFNNEGFVPIIYGCDNFCTYCAVPYTRGREHSRPMNKVITEIKNLVKNDITEITLLGQNVNSYKSSKHQNIKSLKQKSPFVKLLEQIEKIKGLKKISFLTCHPKDVGNDLIDWMSKSPKFSHELHLPLQSGDDKVLLRMNRNYTARHYLELVESCKSKVKKLRLTTDIIVGFPGETREQFENTYNLCKKVGFAGAYVSQFSPRAGTPAAKLRNDVTQQEKKKRWLALNSLINKKEA